MYVIFKNSTKIFYKNKNKISNVYTQLFAKHTQKINQMFDLKNI